VAIAIRAVDGTALDLIIEPDAPEASTGPKPVWIVDGPSLPGR
jgi:hypothetical protein